MTRPFVLGTAGHIDHGKTALVARLTGVNTDRLPGEKQRGITIDLGYAPLDLDGVRVSVVDVPGHERFIKNMLAGATGVDAVILVVAADDSVMPQTREHIAILELLRIRQGVIAVTKTDLVDDEMLPIVESDIRAAVRGTFLEQAPIVFVSNATGAGVDELRNQLTTMLGAFEAIQSDHAGAPFRLAIDRSFLTEGVGAVVTGTVWSGEVSVGDELELHPLGKTVRVRQIQSHNEIMTSVGAGRRAAINLAGAHHTEIQRGYELATPGSLKPSSLLTAQIHVLPSAPRAMGRGSRVRIAIGTSEIIARVRLLESTAIEPGAGGLCQLRCDESACAVARQPFVIRTLSPVTTIGGGIVLEPNASPINRKQTEVIQLVHRLGGDSALDRVNAAIQRLADRPWTALDLARRAGVTPGQAERLTSDLSAQGVVVELADSRGRSVRLHRATLKEMSQRIIDEVQRHDTNDPQAPRLRQDRLRQDLSYYEAAAIDAVVSNLQGAGALNVNDHGVALVGSATNLTPEQSTFRDALLNEYQANGFKPPNPQSLAEAHGRSAREVERTLKSCVSENMLVRIAGSMYLHESWEKELIRRVRRSLADGGSMAMSDLRDMLETSRKYAVPIGEHLDRIGLTRRHGDVRVLAPHIITIKEQEAARGS